MILGNVIFVTWDGPQTAYLEKLFLPLFKAILCLRWRVHVVQFTWAGEARSEIRRRVAAENGVELTVMKVDRNRGFVRLVWTVFSGARRLRRLVAANPNSILMYRSIVPAVIVRFLFVRRSTPLVYDSDGLPIEEKLEQCTLKFGSVAHRFLNSAEKWALKSSVVVLARSEFGARRLIEKAFPLEISGKVQVVSNGRVDAQPVPTESVNRTATNSDHLKLCHLGSWGDVYRPHVMFEIAQRLRREFSGATFQIFTGDLERASLDLHKAGLGRAEWVSIRRLESDQVRAELSSCDIGFSFREVTPSTKAASPMKLGEYLESGLAIVGDMIGDATHDLVQAELMHDPEKSSEIDLFAWVRKAVIAARHARKKKALAIAKELFSIDIAARQYHLALSAAKAQLH